MSWVYYHGSCENRRHLRITRAIDQRNPNALFDGVFASTEIEVAESHGDYIYELELDDEYVAHTEDLSGSTLPYEGKVEHIRKVDQFLSNFLAEPGEESLEKAWDVVIYEENFPDDELEELFGMSNDYGELQCHIQDIRGQLARELGYLAVALIDEHGTSYYITHGLVMTRHREIDYGDFSYKEEECHA